MSVIREARALATEIVEIDGILSAAKDASAALEFANDCKLGLTLAHLIVEGYVTRVDDKALALLDNAVNRGRTIANRPAGPLDLEAEGPIFPVGAVVMVSHKYQPVSAPAEKCVVQSAEWDGDNWVYVFATAAYNFEVTEGDLSWDVQEFCADEV